jgi:hypothetical protein
VRRVLVTVVALVAGTLLPLGAGGAASAAPCTNPQFVTSDENGMWSDGKYVVHNNMWNTAGYAVTETLEACSYRNWQVTATADDSSGDGAVKTYPNVHVDYHDWDTGREPLLRSFSKIRSSWSATTPGVGIYNAAYDIWINGVPGEHEVMIWTDNLNQVPAGSPVATKKFSGQRWRVWASQDNGYIAFVPQKRLTHGRLNIKRMLGWLVQRGRLSRSDTLGQICFGFEIVSTGGRSATFKVDDFSVTAKRR